MKVSVEGNARELKEFFSKDKDIQVKEMRFDSREELDNFLRKIMKRDE